MRLALFALTLTFFECSAAIPRRDVARDVGQFVRHGIFEGGERIPAVLENFRLGRHRGFERWVLDFTVARDKSAAPRYQLRYDEGSTYLTEQGETRFRRKPRFILAIQALTEVRPDQPALNRLAQRSRLVEEVQIYPPVEGGDRVVEMILDRRVTFAPHQPIEKAGRFVLDIRPQSTP